MCLAESGCNRSGVNTHCAVDHAGMVHALFMSKFFCHSSSLLFQTTFLGFPPLCIHKMTEKRVHVGNFAFGDLGGEKGGDEWLAR